MNGNGTLNRAEAGILCSSTTIGKDVVIRVTASVGGRTQSMGIILIVRQLPDPSPFIEYTEDGTPKRYRGGRGLSKSNFDEYSGIVAAIDDGLLNINFRCWDLKLFSLIIWEMPCRKCLRGFILYTSERYVPQV